MSSSRYQQFETNEKSGITYAVLPLGKKVKVYKNDGETYTDRFKKLYKLGTIKEFPNDAVVYNEKTNRFVKRTSVYTKKGEIRKNSVKKSKKVEKSWEGLKNSLKEMKGETVRVVVKDDKGKMIRDFTDNIPENSSYKTWWVKVFKATVMVSSATTVFDTNENASVEILKVNKITKPTSDLSTQKFKDGITHCVLTPILEWATEKIISSQSPRSKFRYNLIINKVKDYIKIYKNGIPEEKVYEICNDLQIDITIDLPFGLTDFINAKSLKKRLKLFKFMNTRMDHVELNEVVNNDQTNVETVTRDELLGIQKELDETHTFYTYNKDSTNISKIQTLGDVFSIHNEFGEVVNKFETETGLSDCKICDINNSELSRFVRFSTHYNETVDFSKTRDMTIMKHIDMEKAYTNFHKCTFYEGFLGKITDFRKTDKIESVGLYTIKNIDWTNANKNFIQLNLKLGNIYLNFNSYPSCELKMLMDQGVTFEITHGCWGVNPIDFRFSEPMFNKTEEGISYYAKWTGSVDSHRLDQRFFMKGNRDFFAQIARQTPEDCMVEYTSDGEGCVTYDKKSNKHLGHIVSFITAYQRMQVIDQLMNMDLASIVRVCVDGIYFQSNIDVPCTGVFRYKEDMTFNNKASGSYMSMLAEDEDDTINFQLCENQTNYKTELHIGPGGCGKTHINLTNEGFVNIIYAAPSWKLARCKKAEYGINSTVWYRLCTDDPEIWEDIRKHNNVLIVDEVSMMTEEQKILIMNRFSNMKLIFCGDVGYQLPCIDGTPFNKESGFEYTRVHNTNYRCKDKDLAEILESLREKITDDKNDEDIIQLFKNKKQTISKNEISKLYNVQDIILSSTNIYKNQYTNELSDGNKWYVTGTNRLYSNGDIVIGSKPEDVKCEERHCFTIHSIQGETARNKLFIDTRNFFNKRMMYTAISRAQYLDQIVLITEFDKIDTQFEGKIYKIVSDNHDGVYIGSTTKTIQERFTQHKKGYNEWTKNPEVKKFISCYSLMELGKCRIELVEEIKCDTLQDLQIREGYHIKNTKNIVNKYIPYKQHQDT
jgi:hypothetical protein